MKTNADKPVNTQSGGSAALGTAGRKLIPPHRAAEFKDMHPAQIHARLIAEAVLGDYTEGQLEAALVPHLREFTNVCDEMVQAFSKLLPDRALSFKIPLSDGTHAEVSIHGPRANDHVKQFAKIFSGIADNFTVDSVQSPVSDGQAGYRLTGRSE